MKRRRRMASAAAMHVLSCARRVGAAAVARSNLTIITGAHAMRVLFDGRRAMGIAYRRRGPARVRIAPGSRGEIGLKSADPLADPRIQPNYLADPADLRTLVAGVRAARRILAAPAFDCYRGLELFPGEEVRSDAAIEAFVRQRCETLYHPVGTRKMDVDAMAVVAPDLRLRGLDDCAWSMRRSCPRSSAATPTRRPP